MVDAVPQHIMGIYVFVVINLLALLCCPEARADVAVINTATNDTVVTFEDKEAGFGPSFPKKGLEGRIVYANPIYACSKLQNPAPQRIDNLVWILLISRGGNCQFADKVINAQVNNYAAAIVHNYNTSGCNSHLINMGGTNGSYVTIPSTFVGCDDGLRLAKEFNHDTKYIIGIRNNQDYRMYLWPFAIVIASCFIIVLVFMITKLVRNHAQKRINRLSSKHLKKIPVRKFKKGDYYDTCAICLEEYDEGEKIRVLPCDHVYHTKCIDPWLTKNKKTCPVCKQRVIPGRDSDSDDSGSTASGHSESTPLLSGQSSTPSSQLTYGGPQTNVCAVLPIENPDTSRDPSEGNEATYEETDDEKTNRLMEASERMMLERQRILCLRQVSEAQVDELHSEERRRQMFGESSVLEGGAASAVVEGYEEEVLREMTANLAKERREMKKKRREEKRKRRTERMEQNKGKERRLTDAGERLVVVEDEEDGFVSAQSSFKEGPRVQAGSPLSSEEGAVGSDGVATAVEVVMCRNEDYVNPSYSESQEELLGEGRKKTEMNEIV